MSHDVFISYSTVNKQTADAICHVLEENNLKCWIAPRNIHSGSNYADEIINGLKSTKIVVLVFSKDSQKSPFVNNEIDIAFSNNKPIISFKIDETMPRDKMEFFLKNKHWLEAYPNPEKEFKTLVRDATRLCEKEELAYISISDPETSSNNILDSLQVSRDKDLISFILLCTPLYSLDFIYMGILAYKKKWIVNGLIYLIIPALLIYHGADGYHFITQGFILLTYVSILWIVAFIHGIIIRKEFLARKTVSGFMPRDNELYEDLVKEYSRI